jgi:hypothetical protein
MKIAKFHNLCFILPLLCQKNIITSLKIDYKQIMLNYKQFIKAIERQELMSYTTNEIGK